MGERCPQWCLQGSSYCQSPLTERRFACKPSTGASGGFAGLPNHRLNPNSANNADSAENADITPTFSLPPVQHVAEVPLIFLAYNQVSTEGACIPLIQVATAVVQSLKDDTAIDAVQLMCNGWCIYVHTHADQTALVNLGITLVGKYIPLKSVFHPKKVNCKGDNQRPSSSCSQ